MKTVIKLSFASRIFGMMILLSALVFNQGCKKENDVSAADPSAIASASEEGMINPIKGNNVVNLVSDVSQYNPTHLDGNLVNAWGLAFGPTGGAWISSNGKNQSVIYDQMGNTLRPPVAIPFGADPNGGSPSGQVYNFTNTFMIQPVIQAANPSASADRTILPRSIPSKFIFATENGTIAAWGEGSNAVIMADRSSTGAVYKGLEIANVDGAWYLYATDFHNGKIDVFDGNFNYVSMHQFTPMKSFTDPTMPSGYAPFNIRRVGGSLVVTYAKQKAPDNHDDLAGPGNGYVDIYTSNGFFVRRLASQGMLNSPWGIEVMRTGVEFATAEDQNAMVDQRRIENNIILIGNFGDGRITAFKGEGKLLGQLKQNGKPIEIEGLWALSYAPPTNAGANDSRDKLYFTSGPAGESHGIFGYVTR